MNLRHITLTAILALASFCVNARSVDSLYIDARGSFLQDIQSNGGYSSTLAPEYFNIHMWGRISDNLTYRIRQRLNVPVDSSNPFRATDWLCLNWQATEKLKLYAGKTAIMIGGYEYDSAPIDVYFYSLFCSNLSQGFAFSVGGEYEFAPGQLVALQVANSPLTNGFNDMYSYNIAWIGHIDSWCNTSWSYNIVDDAYGRKINYIALGNHCIWDGLAFDIDFINRASFDQDQFFFSDYSIISKIIYSLGKWNFCAKIGYESNDPGNYDSNSRPFDTAVLPGTDYIYGGYGIEYFPLGTDRLRLHLAAFTDNATKTHTITAGLKWRFDIL